MCGICGVINFNGLTQDDLNLFTLMFMRSSQRGTDACGVGDQSGRVLRGSIPSKEMAGQDIYTKDFLPKALGKKWIVGHTRHATRGDPKQLINDHPLKIRANTHVVHNGVVSRVDMELPEDTTKTDSYIIVNAINKDWEEGDLFNSVKKAYKRFRGSAAVCVFSKKEIVLARNINPIRYANYHTGAIVFASESDFFPEARPFEIMKDEHIIGWNTEGTRKEDKLEVVGYQSSQSWMYDWRYLGQSSLYDNNYQDDEEVDEKPIKGDYVYRYNPFTKKHVKVPREDVYGNKKKGESGWFKQPEKHSKAYYKGRREKVLRK